MRSNIRSKIEKGRTMEFRDLKKQYLFNKEKIDRAISDVLEDGHFIGGRSVEELEKKLAEYVGTRHCITCANGTDALQLALMAWGVKEGDAVFVPNFTFFATAEVVPWVGGTPIFVDVDEVTFNISVELLEEAIKDTVKEGKLNPKVVIAVDLFGQPADYIKIREIADKYNLLLLEDAAQGFGGSIGTKVACSFGDIATTSFFPAKPLGCYGDGGAIFTDNDEWAEIIKSYKVHGKGTDKYDNIRIGMNSRLDTIQAAILLAKLDSFINTEIAEVNRVAEYYTQNLNGIVEVPRVKQGFVSSWAQYTIKLKDKNTRDELQECLKKKDIPSMIYYIKPLHEQGAFKGYSNIKVWGEKTKELCETVLSLPMHPYLTEQEQDDVIFSIKEFLEKK